MTARKMSFPSDIKGCMKDCVLAIFWPRKDILGFFRDHDCTSRELREIEDFKERSLSRAAMVDVIFERLDSRTDSGLGPFRAMLRSLRHLEPI